MVVEAILTQIGKWLGDVAQVEDAGGVDGKHVLKLAVKRNGTPVVWTGSSGQCPTKIANRKYPEMGILMFSYEQGVFIMRIAFGDERKVAFGPQFAACDYRSGCGAFW